MDDARNYPQALVARSHHADREPGDERPRDVALIFAHAVGQDLERQEHPW
jgi:hypothetical protein